MITMKILLTYIIFFLCIINSISAQFAIINDPDGYTNIREQPGANARIVYRIEDYEVFVYDPFKEDSSDWTSVFISTNDYREAPFLKGFIHKSRLLPIDSLAEPSKSEFSFEYQLDCFQIEDNTIDYHEDGWIKAINGIPYHGELPKIHVKEIRVKINGKSIIIPKIYYEDLFQRPHKVFSTKKDGHYFVSNFHGDDNGYLTLWVIDSLGVRQRIKFTP
jgi:hypothetical protein